MTLNALLFAGTFHSRHGRRARADVLWQRGLQLTRASLAIDPESIGMRFYLTSFLVVLRDPTAATGERQAFTLAETADINPAELRQLAVRAPMQETAGVRWKSCDTRWRGGDCLAARG